MNAHLLSSLLLCIVCSVVFFTSTVTAHTSALDHVTLMSESGEGLQSAVGEDLESDDDQDPSGIFSVPNLFKVNNVEEQNHKPSGRKKNKGRKKNTNITPVQPHHTFIHKSQTTTADPCLTSHLDYCIHGHCTYLHDLREPVCVCKRGYDGERCGIQLLQTSGERDDSSTETTHTALIIMAVILSVISCLAILLMICVHYRTHHQFQAAFLSSANEREQLEKKNIVV
ncbi:proheparin-binding EGF-like growth factor [Myxocyprinus asiaticus]|uniref:proheparin-binding EGF-like growth factor n=1 Tax=Myxocyprinus asiaticus TaxID=70543 RepID=UPI0022226397|nr:proheparin-binding EGF-like growth factor [Myxocyprinus asiaticus]